MAQWGIEVSGISKGEVSEGAGSQGIDRDHIRAIRVTGTEQSRTLGGVWATGREGARTKGGDNHIGSTGGQLESWANQLGIEVGEIGMNHLEYKEHTKIQQNIAPPQA